MIAGISLQRLESTFKLIGKEKNVDSIVAAIEAVFGKVTSSKKDGQISDFVNCGVRHQRLPDGSVSKDQDDYIAALKKIRSEELRTAKSTDPCSTALHGLYSSLLGAVAYAMLTQSDAQAISHSCKTFELGCSCYAS